MKNNLSLPYSAPQYTFAQLLENLELDNENVYKALNDNISQTLLAIRIVLSEAKNSEDKRPELLDLSCKYLDIVISDLRSLTQPSWLHAVSGIHFIDAVQTLAENLNKDQQLQIKWDIRHPVNGNISRTKKTLIYKILQAQLTNIIQATSSKMVVIKIETTSRYVSISITDNSASLYTIEQYHNSGLAVMKQRIEMYEGRFSLTFRSGMGNLLAVHLPL